MKKYTKNINEWVATGFGLGYLPWAPGTWGTLGGIVLYGLLWPFPDWFYAIFVISLSVWGCHVCEQVAKASGICDERRVVVDEIAGYTISLLGMPKQWTWMLAGFIAFRVADIIKPWPIRWVDKNMKNGIGMMLDDILAGVLVCLVFHIVRIYL